MVLVPTPVKVSLNNQDQTSCWNLPLLPPLKDPCRGSTGLSRLAMRDL